MGENNRCVPSVAVGENEERVLSWLSSLENKSSSFWEAKSTMVGHGNESGASNGKDWLYRCTPVLMNEPRAEKPIRTVLNECRSIAHRDSHLLQALGCSHEDQVCYFCSRKNSMVLRTQVSVRVHTIMDRLRASSARELRCALFALKQIFLEDKEIVHEFIASHGLDCLISVAKVAEEQYVSYVVRAVGQIMLYVDGMNGIMEHKICVQWLYSLVSFPYRGVPKTTLKLLLVFLEYTTSNGLLLIKAINEVDKERGPWSTIVDLLHYCEEVDFEIQAYGMTLINKCLNSLTDLNMYYDQTDALEKQNISGIIEKHVSNHSANVDLLKQFRLYEAVLSNEDGEEVGPALRKLDETISQSKMSDSVNNNNKEAVKTNGHNSSQSSNESDNNNNTNLAQTRRKMRMLRQKSFMMEQEKNASTENGHKEEDETSDSSSIPNGNSVENGTNIYTSGLQQRIQNGTLGHTTDRQDLFIVINSIQASNNEVATPVEKDKALLMKREGTVRDLAQKLSSTNIGTSARTADDKFPRVGDTSGIISKAMKGLSESNSKVLTKYSVIDVPVTNESSDYNFEDEVITLEKELKICDLDFTDLQTDNIDDIFNANNMVNGVPPPPPLAMFPLVNVPPPPPTLIPPPLPYCFPVPPSSSVTSSVSNSLENDTITKQNEINAKKTKKTMKLFWKEIIDKPASDVIHEKAGGFIWDEIKGVELDTALIEYLFESRTKELSKKFYETNPKKELTVLEHKRSQAINIVKAKLPTPRTIIAAILKMDSTVITRESIDKLLGMLPTEEETSTILEAQRMNPNVPLASAEKFLMTLSGIPALSARLKVWVFKMDFEFLQKEIAEPLMDLKLSLDLLRTNETFKCILGTIKSIGEFLNGSSTKGFQIEYLAKVAEVKDTVHKNSLLHHLCQIVLENYPQSTDLFSEIGPVIRASKEDFVRLSVNIERLAMDCIASREHLWQIAKHDGAQVMDSKLAEFLKECMQNILVLRRINEVLDQRYRKFLLYIGTPFNEVKKKKPNETLKVIADFSLEYRTARERVIVQKEKKENHKERKKTLGKMITEVAHTDFQKVIQADQSSSLGLVRTNLEVNGGKGDELIESLARIIAHPPSPRQCQRRTRLTDRKSLRRTLTGSSKDNGF